MKHTLKFLATVSAFLLIGAGSASPQQRAPAARPTAATPAPNPPDLSGIWKTMNSAWFDILDHEEQLGVPAGLSVVEGGIIPYRPEALERRKRNFENRATLDPEAKCFM